MNKSLKQKIRRAKKDNPELPIRFIITILKAEQEMNNRYGGPTATNGFSSERGNITERHA